MAKKLKRKAVMVNLEDAVYEAMSNLAGQLDTSYSAYCRDLVIKDLRDRGLLPDRLLAELFSGSQVA